MSSATSTEPVGPSTPLGAGAAPTIAADSPAFRPWQFFLIAGMLAATAVVIVATGQSPIAIVLLSLTIVAASFVGLGVYRSLVPLIATDAPQAPVLVGGRTRAALEREKTLVLRSIKDLEFDFAMGKLAQADFDEMSGRLRGRALRLMRQLEAGQGYRGEIERELKTRLGSVGSDVVAGLPPPREASADRRSLGEGGQPRLEGAAKAAPLRCACGTTNDPDARFCKQCGTKF